MIDVINQLQAMIDEKMAVIVLKQKIQQTSNNMESNIENIENINLRIDILIKFTRSVNKSLLMVCYQLQSRIVSNMLAYTELTKYLVDSIINELLCKIIMFIRKINQNETDIGIVGNLMNLTDIEFLINLSTIKTTKLIKYLDFDFYDQIKMLEPESTITNFHDECNTLLSNCEFEIMLSINKMNGVNEFPIISKRQYFEES